MTSWFSSAPRRRDGVNGKIVRRRNAERGREGRKEGSLGVLCPVCGRSAGVSCRTRLRWPTPVRLRRTVVSKERITGAVLMEELPGRRTFPSAFLFLFPPSLKVSSDFLVSSAAGFPFPCLSVFPLPSGSSRFFPFFSPSFRLCVSFRLRIPCGDPAVFAGRA